MNWFHIEVDAIDVIVLIVVLFSTIYYFCKFWIRRSSKTLTEVKIPSYSSPNNQLNQHVPFISRMKSEGRKVLIIYGSQTGTAEELAGRLAKDVQNYGQKAFVLDPEEMDNEDFERIIEIPDMLLIMCMATYGEGDPTDNAVEFYQHVCSIEINLKGIKFAVFGLGNRTYEHFNQIGKYFDQKLEQLGATRIYELGLGDDDGNLEEDFMRWREGFWPAVANIYGWELSETSSLRQYRFEVVTDFSINLYTGEYNRLDSFKKQRPPFDHRNPFLSTIKGNFELHGEKSDRSCRHIEFIINDATLRYEAGDHLGIFPTNDPALVKELGRLLDTNLDIRFSLINLDEESSKKSPFPCPCTVNTALTHYVDICAPIKSHVLKALASYTSDQNEREHLLLLSTASKEGLLEYGNYIQKERRSVIDILREFSTCKPPADYLLELLPRLQPRYYSISSSPKHTRNSVTIMALITKYTVGNRLIKGVCTNYLLQKDEGSQVPIFVRKSTMRLPHRLQTPVIMIGPGTGFAPFRSFLQERSWQKDHGHEIGQMTLYFGCRHPEHDYIYEEELKAFVKNGVLSQLHIAFSRVTSEKIYVQHKIWINREAVWEAIENGAHIYVCGDARNMARDVLNTLIQIYMKVGGKSESEAHVFQKSLERKRRYQADVWS
ncbi:unnamed protein product [Thelazia callipaeda]|uniref:NADPH--cytochrome P450 reductase n=1 Tax=Thelazia callipaeda TaxID=103827 RepID=A0A158RC93_THECL|nr:unnamed protein product [Thelazia callipaeda]